MTHYVYGSGEHGCSYDSGSHFAATIDDASYCEIYACCCSEPWDHAEDPQEREEIKREFGAK